jgi:hypothetical protein
MRNAFLFVSQLFCRHTNEIAILILSFHCYATCIFLRFFYRLHQEKGIPMRGLTLATVRVAAVGVVEVMDPVGHADEWVV